MSTSKKLSERYFSNHLYIIEFEDSVSDSKWVSRSLYSDERGARTFANFIQSHFLCTSYRVVRLSDVLDKL